MDASIYRTGNRPDAGSARTIGPMNLRTFLLTDSVLLDIAAVVAFAAGQAVIGGALLAVAAIVFVAFLALGRPGAAAGRDRLTRTAPARAAQVRRTV